MNCLRSTMLGRHLGSFAKFPCCTGESELFVFLVASHFLKINFDQIVKTFLNRLGYSLIFEALEGAYYWAAGRRFELGIERARIFFPEILVSAKNGSDFMVI